MKQLTLGELINKLEAVQKTKEYNDEVKSVSFDFGTAIPTTIDSWRGDYSHAALGYELTGYDNSEKHMSEIKLDVLVAHLKSCINKSFYGWKGGDYLMGKSTPIWVANSGNVGSTALVDVLDAGWQIVLITAYKEY